MANTETDLIAELAEVVRGLDSIDQRTVLDATYKAAYYLRTHHATLTRIIESEATIRADYDALVIRLGEVTERLEAADRYITAMHDAMNAEYDAAKQMHSKRQQEWVTAYSMLRRLKSAAAHMSDAAMHNSAREGLE